MKSAQFFNLFKKISVAENKQASGVLLYTEKDDQIPDILTRHYVQMNINYDGNNAISCQCILNNFIYWPEAKNGPFKIPCLMITHEDAEILLRYKLYNIFYNADLRLNEII